MHRRLSLPALAAALILAAGAATANLPAGTAAFAPELRESGRGRLTWLGFHVYDARLWLAGRTWDPAQSAALSLRYARDFSGERIAQTSIDEIRRLGFGTATERERWLAQMQKLFPDVRAGDELAGLSVPERGVVFFHNGRALGEIAEPGFARAFFAIWLDPRTRAADLRAQLLGERP
jgi:hypothetical protein